MKFFLQTLTAFLTFMTFGLSSMASAQDETASLELYPEDAADICGIQAQQIRVTVKGVYKQGLMKLELYNQDKGFLRKSGRLRSVRVPAQDEPMTVCLNVDTPGIYAVAGYHDLDGNRKLKKGWNFMPKEPFVISNNIKFEKLRLPKFEEAAFDVPATGTSITLFAVDPKAKKKQNTENN